MSPTSPHLTTLPHSERKAPSDASRVEAVDPNRQMSVSVIVRRKKPLPVEDLGRKKLTHKEFERNYAASAKDFAAIAKFASEHGLAVDHNASSLVRRTVVLRGTAKQMQSAFGVTLHDYEDTKTKQHFHAFEGAITVPAAHAKIIESVLGLDARPIARPHFRRRSGSRAAAAAVSFNPPQVASLYNFPTGVNGSGETIGIIELGGGYETSDIQTYFSGLGITPPTVVAVSVDGAANVPGGDPNGADGEVALDIQVAGSIAPGAKIAVYFTPNTEQGFVDAITTAVHDQTNNPSILSISWGGPESSWPQSAAQSLNNACQSAAALGVTITVASGDSGSTDGVSDGQNHVDFPASSPYVLACGGTYLVAVGNGMPQESVWDDLPSGGASGGGVSALFDLPTWQASAGVPGGKMRGVPDVAGDASPESGYNVLVDGQAEVVGGTSAVAPLWAALIALVNQQKGEAVGFVNPTLYQNSSAFHDITQGNNGAFQAGPGWDACTGLGSPNGTSIAKAL